MRHNRPSRPCPPQTLPKGQSSCLAARALRRTASSFVRALQKHLHPPLVWYVALLVECYGKEARAGPSSRQEQIKICLPGRCLQPILTARSLRWRLRRSSWCRPTKRNRERRTRQKAERRIEGGAENVGGGVGGAEILRHTPLMRLSMRLPIALTIRFGHGACMPLYMQ